MGGLFSILATSLATSCRFREGYYEGRFVCVPLIYTCLWPNTRASNARKIRHRVGSAETILVASYFKTLFQGDGAAEIWHGVSVNDCPRVQLPCTPVVADSLGESRRWSGGWARLFHFNIWATLKTRSQCPHNTHSHVCSFSLISGACCSVCIHAVGH